MARKKSRIKMILIGTFVWSKGSINDNIRQLLKENKISWYNTWDGFIRTTIGDYMVTACGTGLDKEYSVFIMHGERG